MTAPVRALNATGTAVAIPGRLVYGVEATLTKVQTALLTLVGQWPDDDTWGLMRRRWIERPNTSPIEIEGAVRSLLEQIPGVVEVTRVLVTRGQQLQIAVALKVQSATNVVTARVGDLGDPRTPGAWFLLGVAA